MPSASLRPSAAKRSRSSRLHFTVRVNGQARPRLQAPAGECASSVSVTKPVPARPVAPAQAPRTDALSGSAIDPRMTFETFVPGTANEIALGVAKQVAHAAANNTVTFNPVYIHSTVGLGKSHLLNAIAWAAGAADSIAQHRLSDRRPFHVPLHLRGAAPVGHRASRNGSGGSTCC